MKINEERALLEGHFSKEAETLEREDPYRIWIKIDNTIAVIKNAGELGYPITIPLFGTIDKNSVSRAETYSKEMARALKKLPAVKTKNPLIIGSSDFDLASRVALVKLADHFNLYPKLPIPFPGDRFLEYDYSRDSASNYGLSESIWTVLPLIGKGIPRNTFWHEVDLSTHYGGSNPNAILITVGKNYLGEVQWLPTATTLLQKTGGVEYMIDSIFRDK